MKKYLLCVVLLLSLSSSFAQDGWFYLDAPIIGNSYGAMYPTHEDVVHIVTDDGTMLKTLDGGATWTTFETDVQGYFFDLVFYDENLGIAVGSNGAMVRTTDGGQTWNNINPGTDNDLFSIAFTSPSEVWATGANGTLLHSTNAGSNWVIDNSLTGEDLYSIRYKDTNTGLIAGANGTLYSTINGGANWEAVDIDTNLDLFSVSVTNTYYRFLAGDVGLNHLFDREGIAMYQSSDWVDWETFSFNIGMGISSLHFVSDETGFYLWSEACLCDECQLQILKSVGEEPAWEISLEIQTNAANCIHSGLFYSDVKFITTEVGYALQGSTLFKTMDGGSYTVLDVNEFQKKPLITIYPNPTEDILNIHIRDAQWNSIMVIRDLSGKMLYTFSTEENTKTIDVSGLQTGVYFVQVINNNKVMESKKFIKK